MEEFIRRPEAGRRRNTPAGIEALHPLRCIQTGAGVQRTRPAFIKLLHISRTGHLRSVAAGNYWYSSIFVASQQLYLRSLTFRGSSHIHNM